MNTSHNRPPLGPELQNELSYFVRVRNRYAQIVLGFWKFVLLWVLLLGGFAVAAEIFGLLSRRYH